VQPLTLGIRNKARVGRRKQNAIAIKKLSYDTKQIQGLTAEYPATQSKLFVARCVDLPQVDCENAKESESQDEESEGVASRLVPPAEY